MKYVHGLLFINRSFAVVCLGLLMVISGGQSVYAADSGSACKITPGGKVNRIVKVDMVALNQPFWYNRLGAAQLDAMIYALASDVVLMSDGSPLTDTPDWTSSSYDSSVVGMVTLRPDKRPRPIVYALIKMIV